MNSNTNFNNNNKNTSGNNNTKKQPVASATPAPAKKEEIKNVGSSTVQTTIATAPAVQEQQPLRSKELKDPKTDLKTLINGENKSENTKLNAPTHGETKKFSTDEVYNIFFPIPNKNRTYNKINNYRYYYKKNYYKYVEPSKIKTPAVGKPKTDEEIKKEKAAAEALAADNLAKEIEKAKKLDAMRIVQENHNKLKEAKIKAAKEAKEKLEAEKLAKKKEAEKLEAEKLLAEKLEAEKLEAEKLEAEKLKAKKLAEKLKPEKLDALKLKAKKRFNEKGDEFLYVDKEGSDIFMDQEG